MDDRTRQLAEALDALGVELLNELVSGPVTENALLSALPGTTQPTVNRRLHRLAEAGLVRQEPGKPQAPRRLWSVKHRAGVEAFLAAVLDLSTAVDADDRQIREEARARLARLRSGRGRLHAV